MSDNSVRNDRNKRVGIENKFRGTQSVRGAAESAIIEKNLQRRSEQMAAYHRRDPFYFRLDELINAGYDYEKIDEILSREFPDTVAKMKKESFWDIKRKVQSNRFKAQVWDKIATRNEKLEKAKKAPKRRSGDKGDR